MNSASASRYPPPAARRGFALVEVVISVLVLLCGALSVVAGTGIAIRATSAAERQSTATAAARNRVEMLAAAGCLGLPDSVDSAGVDSSASFRERWTVSGFRHGTRLVTDSVTPAVRRGPAIVLERLVVC